MNTAEALAVLGVSPGATAEEVRASYLRLVRDRHPDRSGPTPDPDATRQTARLTQAYAVVRALLATSDGARVPEPEPTTATAAPESSGGSGAWPVDGATASTEAGAVDSDTIAIALPADEAFGALFEAAGRVGHVAYFDRQLGILETVVRFEGGPTCSVLITLQGRAHGTDAFCTMESIEAAPTPPLRPVVEALVSELVHPSDEAAG